MYKMKILEVFINEWFERFPEWEREYKDMGGFGQGMDASADFILAKLKGL